MDKKKVNILRLREMKQQGRKITMVTAYDYAMMTQVDKADIDLVLVGDSAAMTMLGYEGTVPVDMDTMLIFNQAVSRGGKHTFLVGDMPFMSYEVSIEKAVENAGRIMKEGFMDAVKLEGGERMANTVAAIVRAGIPVMGHIGLTPQSAAQLGGFSVQGKNIDGAKQIVKDAIALENAGVFAIVLEAIPSAVAKIITAKVQVPTIGIGAGPYCDGQVLVIHDLLGLFDRFTPKFVKRYAALGEEMQKALNTFAGEVRRGEFPAREHTFTMLEENEERLIAELTEEGIL
ncbi:3-methyl-2-oxobutanoate hydroxymethyltransferase [Desulfoscipio geothermicus]|uniref:3-methyl-2-oxobutanoate hydroxymethyltransferase n=1 Tax=Desulfoscipio geothermicus DSM 3669 TaxID=1121426 RepID=A0A1I6DLY1_9FIRM|nr:3-methyl-2-oxobutanoate hydroxymethyltransferase [Desulfoscipio geothermicus]SFR06387.1 ketopantoate hydroxymethyltransferase [Desulfoscipio geothermicus DSM 3669]